MHEETEEITLIPINNKWLINLCGPLDENLKQLECQLNIQVCRYVNRFKLKGLLPSIKIAAKVLVFLYSDIEYNQKKNKNISPKEIYLTIQHIQNSQNQVNYAKKNKHDSVLMQTKIILKHKIIKPRTRNQAKYIINIFNHDVTFGIGPAGTGKTFLAIAAAIDLLERQKNQHIILSRPAIEAGEKLGFLPGDFNQKTDPYIRPLYDALCDVIGHERMAQLIQKNMIEVIPLAYMRGRTLSNSIIILDESQNTTITQMKMFLTRIGFNSTVIITGDITQVDLPSNKQSGLIHAIQILSVIKDISFNFFNKKDSVRHSIVTQIIDAYETHRIKNKII